MNPNNDQQQIASASVNTAQHDNSQQSSPQKTSMAPIIAIICAILAIGAIIFGIIEFIDVSQKATEISELKSQLDIQSAAQESLDNFSNSEDSDLETAIRSLITDLKTNIQDSVEKELVDSDDIVTIRIKTPEMKSSIPLEKTYGISSNNDPESTTISNSAIEYLIQNNFKEISTDEQIIAWSFSSSSSPSHYYNEASGIICAVSSPSSRDVFVNCGHISWIDEDLVALGNELADAYYEKTGKSLPETAVISKTMIKDSPIAPYQRIETVLTNGSSAQFYRTSPTAQWQYFNDPSADTYCSSYSTSELKNAFAGIECYDETIGEFSTVQPAS